MLCGQLIPEEEEEEEEEEKYLPMTIGIHKEHPSFITDLERQLKCMSVRTVEQDSHNHVSFYTMLQGAQTDKQKIVCRGKRIWAPESLYERTFHTRRKYGKTACYWVEIEARRHGIHISYQMCWHREMSG